MAFPVQTPTQPLNPLINLKSPAKASFMEDGTYLSKTTSTPCTEANGGRIEYIKISEMRKPTCANKLNPSKFFEEFNYKNILIGGSDRLCWARAAWFSTIRQHQLLGTINDLKKTITDLINNSNDKDVKKYRKRSPNPLTQAFADLDNPFYKGNASLNEHGFMTKDIESMMYHTSLAIFSAYPNESNFEYSDNTVRSAHHDLKKNKNGLTAFTSAILQHLQANVAYALMYALFDDEKNLDVSWLGTFEHHEKQLDHIAVYNDFHLNVYINADNGDFRPANHNYTHKKSFFEDY